MPAFAAVVVARAKIKINVGRPQAGRIGPTRWLAMT
jgi:hypothetical protein